MLRIHVISLFPEVCEPYFSASVIGKARERGALEIRYYNPAEETEKPKEVDDRPYGGGPGMVMRAEPLLRCFDRVKQCPGTRRAIFLTPDGELFTREKAKEYAAADNVALFCGRYEGMDERVVGASGADRVSIGACTLTGGEVPAMLITDAIARERPNVLGNEESREDTRVAGNKVYTRPESFTYEGKEYRVPEVLLSGNHKDIDEYRRGNKKQ